MNILITGAYGFVGTNLSAYLAARGLEAWALDVGSGAVGSWNEEVPRQDAKTQRASYTRSFNWGQLEEIPWGQVDAVVHLAGKAHDTRNASDPQSYFDVNVGLTRRILQSAAGGWQSPVGNGQLADGGQPSAIGSVEADRATSSPAFQHSNIPIRKFILFSSVKAVADRVEGVLTEDAVPDPQTPYGKSKLEAERFVQSAVGGRQSAIRSFILRPCMIHGPGNKGNLNLLYGMVRRGMPWPLGGFENRRSFASIGNVCAVVEGLLTGEVAPGVYQVADDEAISTNDVVRLIAETFGRKPRIWHLPAPWFKAVAAAGDVFHLPLNRERLKKLTESYVVSNARLKAALGWADMPVKAVDGMRKTLMSFAE